MFLLHDAQFYRQSAEDRDTGDSRGAIRSAQRDVHLPILRSKGDIQERPKARQENQAAAVPAGGPAGREERRPLRESILDAQNLSLTYYISRTDSAQAENIQSAVNTAISQYTMWQRSIGRDINPSKLTAMIIAAGAKRVVVSSPIYTKVNATSVANLSGAASITYGGLEDD